MIRQLRMRGRSKRRDSARNRIAARPTVEAIEQRLLLSLTTIDVPGASSTFASGINDAGQVVGSYFEYGSGYPHGFLESGGSFTTIDVPGAFYTMPGGINDAGQVVGGYADVGGYPDTSGPSHGFLESGGSFTTIDVPGASDTSAYGINDGGQVVGEYGNASGGHGFLESGGSFTTIDVPGASYTSAYGINDGGQVVGYYVDASRHSHGFLESGGSFTTIDVPGASATFALGINDAGQVVGYYDNASGYYHGFLESGGSFTTIDVPGASATFALGINDAGQVVGQYDNASGYYHGFLLVLQAAPSFSGLSAPTIIYGTATTTVSGQLDGNAGGQPVPAGETVQVTLNGVNQTATLASNDDFSTTFDTSALTVAGSPYTIGFQYAGDANFTSANASSTLTVNQAGTTTALVGGPSPSVYGQPVTFTAKVTANGPGSGTPTGSVTFMDGTTALNPGGTMLDDSGTATFTTTTLAAGDHPAITAVYGGDTNFSGSTSAAIDQFVGKPDIEATSLQWNNGQVTLDYTINGADLPNATDISFFWASGSADRGTIISPAAYGMTEVTKGPHQFIISSSGFSVPPKDASYLMVIINQTKAVSLLYGDALTSVDLASALIPPTVKLDLSPSAPQKGQPYSVKVEVTNNALVPLDFVRDTREVLDTPDSLRAVTPNRIDDMGVALGTVGVGQTQIFDIGTFTRTWDWIDSKNPITDQVKSEAQLTEKIIKESLKSVASDTGKTVISSFSDLRKVWGLIDDVTKPVKQATLRYIVDIKTDLTGPQTDQTSEDDVTLTVPDTLQATYASYIMAKLAASEFLSQAVAATILGLADPTHFTLTAVVAPMAEFAASMKVAAEQYDQAVDPPDQNYKTLAVPQLIDLPELDALPSSPTKSAALISLQIEALTSAAATANNRAAGAEQAGDATWQSQQLVSAASFTNQASALESLLATLEGQIAPALTANVTAHAGDVSTYISQHGLPASGASILAEMGFSPAQIANIDTYVEGLQPEAFDDPTLTIITQELSSITSNALAANDLSQAAQIRTTQLGQTVSDLTTTERQTLDADRATIQTDLGGNVASDAFLSTISQYLADIDHISEATNNLVALQADIDFSRTALAAFQQVGLASVNQTLMLTAIPNQNVNVGSLLTLTAMATGQGSGTVLAYSLETGAPAGATIDPTTGTFTWTIPTTEPAGDYPVTINVSDDASPPLTASTSFTIHVQASPTLQASSFSAVSGSGDFGATATLTATLTSGGAPLAGKVVSFALNANGAVTPLGTATTDANGIATLPDASIAGANVGTDTGVLTVNFAGDATYLGSTASGSLTVSPRDVTSQVSVTSSGLVYNRSTQRFGGTMTLTNTGTSALDFSFEVVLTNLPAGVALANASGYTANGDPYILVNLPGGALAPGQSVTFTVQFNNPSKKLLQYGAMIFNV